MLNIFIIILTACFSSLNWRVYTDNVNHFKINYPDKWIIQNANGSIVFLSPKEGVQDLFQENVNLMLQDLSQKRMNLEQYTEVTKKQIIDNLGSSAIISLKSTTLAGQRAKEFIYDMNYQGRSLKLKQYWFIKGNIAYLFSYTARTIEVW
ncbi:MAG: hypothetical protein CRN43_02215 [Candidatus Nephrothrix sp. EaCA]|nr:MAG: hypothetical protein CRN43_02215 [Candidatus Nephrothrix sp. EaCA]